MTYLAITDGSTTISLVSDGIYLVDFVPRYEAGAVRITDSIDLRITATNQQNLLNTIRNIESILELSRSYHDNYQGKKAYLLYKPEDNATLVRSPIYNGRIVLGSGATHYKLTNLNLDANLIIERAPYWEYYDLITLTLSNPNGTGSGGINVFNCNDGSGTVPNKRYNYVQIDASNVTGNLPAPAVITVINGYDDSARLNEIYISHNVFSNPSSFQHTLEGERASYGGSNVSGSGYSGGYYRNITWTGDAQALIAYWQLPSNVITYGGGRWFKVFAALASTPASGTYIQSKITFPSGTPLTVIQEDQEILLPNSKFVEIGTFQLPPWLIEQSNLYNLDLVLHGRKTGGGQIAIDFLYFMPAEGFALWKPRGYGLAYPTSLTVDYIENQAYVEGYSPGGKAAIYMLFGKPVLLVPGKTQRLYFHQIGNTGDVNINRKIIVTMSYRPRYGTL